MARKVIKLLGEPIQNEDMTATEAITPGHLVEPASGTTVQKCTVTTAIPVPRTFALEREEAGQDIDTDYAINDVVKVGHFGPGTRVNALIASGVSTTAGVTYLESAGNGTLRAFTNGTRIGRALETKSVTALTRLRVEII